MTFLVGAITLGLALTAAQGPRAASAKRRKAAPAPSAAAAERRVVAPAPARSPAPKRAEASSASNGAASGDSGGADATDGAEATHGASVPAPATGGNPVRAAKTKVYTFGAMDVEGKLKTPQLLYFLNRVKLELEMSAPDHRSFMKELERTADDPSL